MVDRILITPTRVAISRPGYDVKTATISPDFLAVDSSFGKPLRLLTGGYIFNVSIINFPTVSYGTTYTNFPKVFVLPFDSSGSISNVHNLFQKWMHGSAHADLYFNPYNTKMTKSNFTIKRADNYEGQSDPTYYGTNRNWIYLVFPAS
jgi:hypothetical protein